MAARIALSRGNLRNELNELVHAQVSIVGTNDDQVVIRQGPTELLRLANVTVERDTASTYKLTVAGEPPTVYTVEIDRTSGCGCGR